MELQLCGVTIQPHAMFRKTLLVSFDLILPCSSLEANVNADIASLISTSYLITSHIILPCSSSPMSRLMLLAPRYR